jgi:hypothetical protein
LIGLKPASKPLPQCTANVAFGSNSEVELADADFRFTLKADIRRSGWDVAAN